MTPGPRPMRGVVYARVSKAGRDGGTASVDQQIAEMRDLMGVHGVTEAHAPAIDRAISASRARTVRPGWDRLVALVAAGDVDVVAVWESSRSTRRLAQWAAFRDLCIDRGVMWLTRDGLIDPDTGSSRLSGGVAALVAESESVNLSDRVRRTTRAKASEGRPHGRERYGYARQYDPRTGALVGVQIEPSEAAVIRRLVDGALAGVPLRALARALNAEGIPAPGDAVNVRRGLPSHGSLWATRTIRYLLLSRDYTGVRVHRTRKRFDPRTVVDVAEHAAVWPALITDDEHRNLTALLTDPTRNTRGDADGRRHLLSGVLRCNRCGAAMRSVTQPRPGCAVQRYYICAGSGCRGTSIRQDDTDALITRVVLARLARPDAALTPPDPSAPDRDAARRTIDSAAARLDELAAAFADGSITLAAYTAAERALADRVETAEAELRAARPTAIPPAFRAAVDPSVVWEAADVETRHAVITSLISRVVVGPGRKGRLPYDPARVLPGIEWIA